MSVVCCLLMVSPGWSQNNGPPVSDNGVEILDVYFEEPFDGNGGGKLHSRIVFLCKCADRRFRNPSLTFTRKIPEGWSVGWSDNPWGMPLIKEFSFAPPPRSQPPRLGVREWVYEEKFEVTFTATDFIPAGGTGSVKLKFKIVPYPPNPNNGGGGEPGDIGGVEPPGTTSEAGVDVEYSVVSPGGGE